MVSATRRVVAAGELSGGLNLAEQTGNLNGNSWRVRARTRITVHNLVDVFLLGFPGNHISSPSL